MTSSLKTSFKTTILVGLMALAGIASAQTAAISTTTAQSYAGVGGGRSISLGVNVQHAGASGQQGALIGSHAGLGGGFGDAKTASVSAAGNYSQGNADGGATAAGLSQAANKQANTFNNGYTQATVSGNAEAVSGTRVDAGKNSAGLIGGGAKASYLAGVGAVVTPTSVTLGSVALTKAATTPTIRLVTGNNVVTSITNEGAANASAQIKAGDLSSFSSN